VRRLRWHNSWVSLELLILIVVVVLLGAVASVGAPRGEWDEVLERVSASLGLQVGPRERAGKGAVAGRVGGRQV